MFRRLLIIVVLALVALPARAATPAPSRCIELTTQQQFASAETCFLDDKRAHAGWQALANLGSFYLEWGNDLAAKNAPVFDVTRKRELAINAFKAAQKTPDARAHSAALEPLLALAYYRTNRRTLAIAELEKLLTSTNATSEERITAHQHLDQYVREPTRALTPEQTKQHDALFADGGRRVEPYLSLADRAAQKPHAAELHRAIASFEKVLALDPRNWPAMWLTGKAYEALGDGNAALLSFTQARKINPYHPDVVGEEVQQLLRMGRAPEAVTLSTTAIKWNPENPATRANLAVAYLIAGDLVRAKSTAAQALKLAPDDQVTQRLVKRIDEVIAHTKPQPQTLLDL